MTNTPISRLPPLNALRAFEAAARHLSMKKAAEELHVTPAAVTHQVKALEDAIGVKLFHRKNRSLELTGPGREIQPVLHDAFAAITIALRNATWEKSSRITLNLLPSFAQKWLAPRLPRFRALHPSINLQITTSMAFVDFASEEVDAAVRIGTGSWPRLKADLLIEDEFYPVCAPHLLEGREDADDPAILAEFPLLTTIRRPDDWELWLKAAGVEGVSAHRQITHDNSALALEMAAHGLGFAMTRGVFATNDLESGRLIEPFQTRVRSGLGYYFVVPEAFASRPEIRIVRDWLIAEAQGSAARTAE